MAGLSLAERTVGPTTTTREVSHSIPLHPNSNGTSWVPGLDGALELPEVVLFETLKWKRSPVMSLKITFKKPIVEELAKEAGIDLDVLDLLKRLQPHEHGGAAIAIEC